MLAVNNIAWRPADPGVPHLKNDAAVVVLAGEGAPVGIARQNDAVPTAGLSELELHHVVHAAAREPGFVPVYLNPSG